jgi:3-dehydroquinate dehydratase/shikimate dehydrogenase
MTLLIASVHGEIPTGLGGADLLELRIDAFEPDEVLKELPSLLAESPIPTIVTCRSVAEGGMFEGGEEDRIEMYQVALQCDQPPRYIDVEHKSLKNKPHLLDELTSEQTGIILSCHDVAGRPRNLMQQVADMQDISAKSPGVDVVKIVWRARSIRDNIEVFELLRSRQQPMIAMCMGEFGIMSRILAPKFGGFASYAAVDGMDCTAPGQPTLQEFRSKYNFDAINEETLVYGIIGNNVEHSASPTFHNAAFQVAGVNATYLPLQIPEGWEHLKASVRELQHYDALHFTGASITIPHKEEMMKLADSCDEISTEVGAANTITLSNQTIWASNTDVPAVASLATDSSKVLILGGGGVARAAIVAMQTQGAEIYIATRRLEQAESLAKEFSCQVATLENPKNSESPEDSDIDTIVNCTPVGMEGGNAPEGDPLCLLAPWLTLNASIRVFDTVYKPKETPLLIRAKSTGCAVVYGEEMFRLQATAQQQIWINDSRGS